MRLVLDFSVFCDKCHSEYISDKNIRNALRCPECNNKIVFQYKDVDFKNTKV